EAGFRTYKAKRTEASFTSGDATIKVWQFTPTEGKGPWPGVVLLYGLDGLDEFKTTQLFYNIIGGKISDKGVVVQLVFYFDRIKFEDQEVPKLKLDLQKQLLDLEQKSPNPKLTQHYKTWMATVKDGIEQLLKCQDVDPAR